LDVAEGPWAVGFTAFILLELAGTWLVTCWLTCRSAQRIRQVRVTGEGMYFATDSNSAQRAGIILSNK
jgi:hypothetical protein